MQTRQLNNKTVPANCGLQVEFSDPQNIALYGGYKMQHPYHRGIKNRTALSTITAPHFYLIYGGRLYSFYCPCLQIFHLVLIFRTALAEPGIELIMTISLDSPNNVLIHEAPVPCDNCPWRRSSFKSNLTAYSNCQLNRIIYRKLQRTNRVLKTNMIFPELEVELYGGYEMQTFTTEF